MNKRDFNVVGNEGTDNQELAKGIAFVKSRRAELNVVQMVENVRDQAMPNGVIINDAYADFGKNPHGIQGGIRPGIIISCDASNHDGAPQVSVVPLSSKLKDIPVHVILNPKDVSGFGLSKISDFMPEDAQTISKGCIRAKSGTVIEDSGVREEIDRALIRQFDLLPVARKMVMEELANGQQN